MAVGDGGCVFAWAFLALTAGVARLLPARAWGDRQLGSRVVYWYISRLAVRQSWRGSLQWESVCRLSVIGRAVSRDREGGTD